MHEGGNIYNQDRCGKLNCYSAVAFRQKLTSGGSGITILAKGIKQPGIASISKTSGEAIPMANAPAAIPIEAFNEAITLTTGMPYNKRGSVRPSEVSFKEYAPADIPEAADDDPEYEAFIFEPSRSIFAIAKSRGCKQACSTAFCSYTAARSNPDASC